MFMCYKFLAFTLITRNEGIAPVQQLLPHPVPPMSNRHLIEFLPDANTYEINLIDFVRWLLTILSLFVTVPGRVLHLYTCVLDLNLSERM